MTVIGVGELRYLRQIRRFGCSSVGHERCRRVSLASRVSAARSRRGCLEWCDRIRDPNRAGLLRDHEHNGAFLINLLPWPAWPLSKLTLIANTLHPAVSSDRGPSINSIEFAIKPHGGVDEPSQRKGGKIVLRAEEFETAM